ncbi:type II toxin-antitoxin system VapC family toxin [Nocardiopsis mangrovi]|uniref:Type II toxin-antitoxin system VapC family toxin n=1 Tax=Nocardiopsis mangrovi TaxID=1179818 RepID=A0ABV9DT18_9ACTN
MARRRVTIGGTLILDSEGLCKLAEGDGRALAFAKTAYRRRTRVVVSAITLTEVIRGTPRDAPVHRVLSHILILPVTREISCSAGELLGRTGLSGHRCAIDSVVAATALGQERPTVLLTSDPDDMSRLVEEHGCAKEDRIEVVHV